MRQSAVGLLLVGALGLFVGLILWLQHFSPRGRSFRAFFEFPNAAGITEGTRVTYRGVAVGQVVGVTPRPEGVSIEVEITPGDRLIPSSAVIEATQTGLVGETSIDITPLQALPEDGVKAKPLDPNCDRTVILCNGSRLQGQTPLNVQALIRSTLRIANLLTDPQFTANINSVTKNASDALVSVSKLSGDVSGLTTEVRQLVRGGSVEKTLVSVGQAADEIKSLAASNRTGLVATLSSVRQTSEQLRTTVGSLAPVLDQVSQGDLIRNLDVMAANAAEAAANLRDFSANVNDPTNAVMLQQILDSARATFQNIQKLTSDVDELTGDPTLRNNIRNLINGLSHLVSSTQQLQRQTQIAQAVDPLAVAINQSYASVQRSNDSPASPAYPTPEPLVPSKPQTSRDLDRLTHQP
jgi:phospholipid/cholesterol/gamma-HCH transport system substrate-binding protein